MRPSGGGGTYAIDPLGVLKKLMIVVQKGASPPDVARVDVVSCFKKHRDIHETEGLHCFVTSSGGRANYHIPRGGNTRASGTPIVVVVIIGHRSIVRLGIPSKHFVGRRLWSVAGCWRLCVPRLFGRKGVAAVPVHWSICCCGGIMASKPRDVIVQRNVRNRSTVWNDKLRVRTAHVEDPEIRVDLVDAVWMRLVVDGR